MGQTCRIPAPSQGLDKDTYSYIYLAEFAQAMSTGTVYIGGKSCPAVIGTKSDYLSASDGNHSCAHKPMYDNLLFTKGLRSDAVPMPAPRILQYAAK